MTLDIQNYRHKPTYVQAVCVTAENMAEIAEWCKGNVLNNDEMKSYVKVPVIRAINERQTEAYVGDWVLKAGTSFKVYTPKGFEKGFELCNTYDDLVTELSKFGG
jgi:hypothetical protein